VPLSASTANQPENPTFLGTGLLDHPPRLADNVWVQICWLIHVDLLMCLSSVEFLLAYFQRTDLLAQEALLTALHAEDSLPVRTLLKDTVLAMVALGAQDGVSWVHMLCSLVTDRTHRACDGRI
jgi:hypothetical protein